MSAPELGDTFGVSGAWLGGLLLTVPVLLSLVVEPPLFVIADRAADRRGFARAGYAAVAAACAMAALAPAPWMVIAAFAACTPLWSVGVGVAEAALVELDPERAERQMTRWTLAGALGDVAGPALLAGAAALGLGWRAALVVVALWAALAAALVPPLPAAGALDDEPRPSWRQTVAGALRNRRLLAWAAGCQLCALLDEILIVLAAVDLSARLDADAGERALVLGALLAGSAVGLVAVERLLTRVAPQRLLVASSAIGAAVYLAWIATPSIALSAALAAVVGVVESVHYPLAKAQAYRAAPGQPGLVNAVIALFEPIAVALPLLIALVAETAGVQAAMLVLAAQPVGLFVLAVSAGRPPQGAR